MAYFCLTNFHQGLSKIAESVHIASESKPHSIRWVPERLANKSPNSILVGNIVTLR